MQLLIYRNWSVKLWALLVTLSPCHLVTLSSAHAAGKLEYNRDIRPILAENCFACHGPDSAARKAGLRLDQRDEAIKAGAILPGKPDESALVERIFTNEAKELMPPAKAHKKLTAAQKQTLKQWVAGGAEYQPHWSFIAPKRPALPPVKNQAWVRNPIDRFILAELEKKGLQPAPEADRRTLARRLSLDLIGLPPKPEDVEEFVNDPSANAYERLVEKILKSPHWGEHRGRYWLDAARYADTHGIHFDNFREMYSYRDWVINAFNRNQPFDQFTIEQLAGDLLPGATLDQKIATGFNRCNITTNEGGAIAEEYLVLYNRDRTETTAQVWMGLTANCAVCHDHKFDPLTMRDFYSMAAFFNNTTQAAMDGNIPNTPPILVVPRNEDRPRWEQLSRQSEEIRDRLEARKKSARGEFDRWVDRRDQPAGSLAEEVARLVPSESLRLHARLTDAPGQPIQLLLDGKAVASRVKSPAGKTPAGKIAPRAFTLPANETIEAADAGDFEKNQAFSVGAWVRPPKRGLTGAVVARMDNGSKFRGWDLWLERDRVGMHIINQWPEDALKVVSRQPLQPGKWQHVFATYDGSGKAAGVKIYIDGQPQPVDIQADKLQGTIRTRVPLTIGQRHHSDRVPGLVLQDLRLYGKRLTGQEVAQVGRNPRIQELLARPIKERKAEEVNELFDWWLASLDPQSRELNAKLAGLQQEEVAIRSRGTVAHVMQERPSEPMAYILYRGEYDKRRDPVKANTPASLPKMPDDLPRNRLGFAQWLLRPEHPLTTRVTVNRFWQELFGTGLVRTTGDFGISGELPSHPELLDWLAIEFRESGWDVKKFFTLLVTSATYRQAALLTPAKHEKDPNNRLLSRGARYRMDAEMIRDYALAASGLLVPKIGGPSVRPYQPEGVWEAVAMIGSNTRDYRRDTGESLYRRSLYTFWKRAAPPASMDILNAPNRETCAVRRERTNTPLQALVTLNDVQFVEAARHLAQQAVGRTLARSVSEGHPSLTLRASTEETASPSPASGLDLIARRLLARPFRPEEQKVVQGILNELLAHYKAHPDEARKLIAVGESKADPALDPATLAAWTMVVNQLMNLDEVLCK